MAIQGHYYRLSNDEAASLRLDDTRQPLDPEDLTNLRQNNDKTEFIINTVEALEIGTYEYKFEDVNEMNAYIQSTESWRTLGMVATDDENEAAVIEVPYKIQPNNLKYYWAPKIIMNVTDGEGTLVKVSTDINVDNTDNVEGNFITKWKDFQTLTTLNTKAAAGGLESALNLIPWYDNGMIYQGKAGEFGEEATGMMTGFPDGTAAEDWSIVFGFQNSDGERTNSFLLGTIGDELTTYWAFKSIYDTKYSLYNQGELVHTFTIPDGAITSQRQLRATQMQCGILVYDSENRKLYFYCWDLGEEEFTSGEPYIVPEEFEAPALFDKWGNTGMGETNSEFHGIGAGMITVWDSMLTLAEAKLMKEHIATL